MDVRIYERRKAIVLAHASEDELKVIEEMTGIKPKEMEKKPGYVIHFKDKKAWEEFKGRYNKGKEDREAR